MWSSQFDSKRGGYLLISNQEPRVTLFVKDRHETEVMGLLMALEQSKAKPEILKSNYLSGQDTGEIFWMINRVCSSKVEQPAFNRTDVRSIRTKPTSLHGRTQDDLSIRPARADTNLAGATSAKQDIYQLCSTLQVKGPEILARIYWLHNFPYIIYGEPKRMWNRDWNKVRSK